MSANLLARLVLSKALRQEVNKEIIHALKVAISAAGDSFQKECPIALRICEATVRIRGHENAVRDILRDAKGEKTSSDDASHRLCGAVATGDLELVTAHLESGNNNLIDSENGIFQCPFRIATVFGYFDIIKYFLRPEFEVRHYHIFTDDYRGISAMIRGYQDEKSHCPTLVRQEIVSRNNQFIDYAFNLPDAPIRYRDTEIRYCILVAARYRNLHAVELLLSKAAMKHPEEHPTLLLHTLCIAAHMLDLELLQLLLSCGVLANAFLRQTRCSGFLDCNNALKEYTALHRRPSSTVPDTRLFDYCWKMERTPTSSDLRWFHQFTRQ